MRPTPVRLSADKSKGHLWPGQRSVPATITGCSRSSSLFQMLMTSLSRMPPFGGSATNVNGSNSSLKRMMTTSILIQCKPMINQIFQKTRLCCPTTLYAAVVFQCLLKVQKSRTENTKAGRFRFLSKKVVSGTLAYMSGPCHTLPYGCKDLRNPPSPRLKLP